MSPEYAQTLITPEYQPYDYQVNALDALANTRNKGADKALVVMATGLGKTAVAAFDVQKFLEESSDKKVLYLCHQNDILIQARKIFENTIGQDKIYGFMNGDQKDPDADIIFGSFQTMQEWRTQFDQNHFSYVVVDESHHSRAETYLPTIQYFQPDFLLAITATPDRADLLDIRHVFGKEIFNLPLERALARGFLTKVDYRIMTDKVKSSSILVPGEKINLAKLNREIFIPRRDKEVAQIIQEKMAEVENPKVGVFCKNIEHAEAVAKLIPGSLPYHSRQPRSTQNKTLEGFRQSQSGVIVTVDKFNEGVDVPEINIIAFLRSTQTRTIFYQQLGRGLRKREGKEKVVILDFVGNIERLKMLQNLQQGIKNEKRKLEGNTEREITDTSEIINEDRIFEFDEQAINLLEVLSGIEKAPEGWMTISLLKNHLNKTSEKGEVDEKVNYYCSTHPEWVNTYVNKMGALRDYYHPDLIAILKAEYGDYSQAPEGWLTLTSAQEIVKRSYKFIKSRANKYRESKPEWFGYFLAKRGGAFEHYSPELIKILQNKAGEEDTSWENLEKIARDLNRSTKYLKRLMSDNIELHPDWFKQIKGISRTKVLCSPEFTSQVKSLMDSEEKAPEGWMTNNSFASELEMVPDKLQRKIAKYRETNPEWFKIYLGSGNKQREHYSPELIQKIKEGRVGLTGAPEGWYANLALSKVLQKDRKKVQKIADTYRDEHSEWFRIFINNNNGESEYYSPELVEILKNQLS